MTNREFYEVRETFFRSIYSGVTGYACLATLDRNMKNFHETFFEWPSERPQFMEYIEEHWEENNVYFCPQLFTEKRRAKATVAHAPSAWADLDNCPPSALEVEPTYVLLSSKGKYQALWILDQVLTPDQVENLSRRIATAHKTEGADHCWNLGRLLRVPFTLNYKYVQPELTVLLETSNGRYRLHDFDAIPQVIGNEASDIPFPETLPDKTAEELMQEYSGSLHESAHNLFEVKPAEDKSWSHVLWSLLLLLFEAGMTREEAFIVSDAAACNKWKREGKPKEYLWNDVCRAWVKAEFNAKVTKPRVTKEAPVLTDSETTRAMDDETWVERYIEWASSLGDAAPQYHQAGAFVALSSLLAGSIRLPTSFGTIMPNIWFMILADTTLTRKTTSMDIAMDMLEEIDDEALLATDGSIEGMYTAMSTRPGRPSVFLRDEFSGLLEAMLHKDYMAGFPEMLTKLYDGKLQKRILRKETIEVKNPCLILYTGGIRSKVQDTLTLEEVASGFLPRFIFITAESDVSKVQPLGPPTEKNWGARDAVLNELKSIGQHYTGFHQEKVNDKLITTPNRKIWTAELTSKAWARYNILEQQMMLDGVNSSKPEVFTPVWDRLCKSILKSAILIAASKQRDSERVVVEEIDLIHAIYYGEQWRQFAKQIIVNVGHSKDERRVQTILNALKRNGGSAPRTQLMQSYHLHGREAQEIFATLEQRGLITRTRMGKTEMITLDTGENNAVSA